MTTDNLYSAEGVQARCKKAISQLDEQLGQFQYCNDFERMTGVPKTYVVLGAGGLFAIMIFFNIAGQLITNFISWGYPAYASFKAIETPSPADDKQWLTYWTVIGFVQIVEYFSDLLLFWVPFYFLIKTVFVLWLALPQFRGAEILYGRFIRPFLLEAQSDIDRHAHELKEKASSVASEFISKKD
ncbi:TB2/DP1, HVA22 family-domain-containing protein [Zychaea mexicana]|uniref:TB2/DP1, HVA22 family-domain-containing protein n=1 Tax=Zychaea mexicana TaxID=64656 RepID=UPI0022FE5990|nr:TB2/DP1, HVA22 family-domain-containing protein [Zychaea mexicana]KAI9493296.1 TB2/DP1, HVA22 family-domain-containing protein [Zychaea mexicana]